MADADREDPVLATTGAELLAGLADGSLPPAQFNHAAHLRVAWELLGQLPPEAAEQRFCELVVAYVRGLGASDRFHRTLSIALMRLVAGRRDPGGGWDDFRQRNPELFDDAPGLIARHYSAERLAAGRIDYVGPDLLPLPSPQR